MMVLYNLDLKASAIHSVINAIAITFERVSSSPSVYLRDNANVAYTEIKLYTNSTVTDSADALSIITNSSFAHFSEGAMYTHDKTARTVTLWTSHLSTAKENSTSSGGGDESDSNSPMSGTPSANSTRLMPEGPALSYIFILMVFISPTFVPISGNSVWYLSTFTVRPLYSTNCHPKTYLSIRYLQPSHYRHNKYLFQKMVTFLILQLL